LKQIFKLYFIFLRFLKLSPGILYLQDGSDEGDVDALTKGIGGVRNHLFENVNLIYKLDKFN